MKGLFPQQQSAEILTHRLSHLIYTLFRSVPAVGRNPALPQDKSLVVHRNRDAAQSHSEPAVLHKASSLLVQSPAPHALLVLRIRVLHIQVLHIPALHDGFQSLLPAMAQESPYLRFYFHKAPASYLQEILYVSFSMPIF